MATDREASPAGSAAYGPTPPSRDVPPSGEAERTRADLAAPKVLVGEILRPGDEEQQRRQEHKVRRGFFSTVKRAARHIPFMEDVVASYHCALDPQTPAASRGILLAALAYFVLPIDVVPDFIVGLGFTDDMAVLMAAFSAVQRNIRPEHYEKARETLRSEDDAASKAAA